MLVDRHWLRALAHPDGPSYLLNGRELLQEFPPKPLPGLDGMPARRGATIRKARGGKAVEPVAARHVRREASRADCREEYAAREN